MYLCVPGLAGWRENLSLRFKAFFPGAVFRRAFLPWFWTLVVTHALCPASRLRGAFERLPDLRLGYTGPPLWLGDWTPAQTWLVEPPPSLPVKETPLQSKRLTTHRTIWSIWGQSPERRLLGTAHLLKGTLPCEMGPFRAARGRRPQKLSTDRGAQAPQRWPGTSFCCPRPPASKRWCSFPAVSHSGLFCPEAEADV